MRPDGQSALYVASAITHREVVLLRAHGANEDYEWMGLRADDIMTEKGEEGEEELGITRTKTQQPPPRFGFFLSGDEDSAMYSRRSTSGDEDSAMYSRRPTRATSAESDKQEHGNEGHDEDELLQERQMWAGPVRVDYAEIWAVLQMKVPLGELVFDSKKLIDCGASCKVYRTEVYGLLCAIKVLSSSFLAKGSKAKKQFVAEIDILTSCMHANICRLYASSTNGDHKCAILELMDTPLEKRLMDPEYPPLSWEQRVYIALCKFRGVVALHSRRPVRIHRDIKTSNILLNGFKTSTLHPGCIAKISDFGTARAFDPRVNVSTAPPQTSTATAGITHG
jgi:serine/threonine protein kinase